MASRGTQNSSQEQPEAASFNRLDSFEIRSIYILQKPLHGCRSTRC